MNDAKVGGLPLLWASSIPSIRNRDQGTVAIGNEAPPLLGVLAGSASAASIIIAATFSMREESRNSDSRSETATKAAHIPASSNLV